MHQVKKSKSKMGNKNPQWKGELVGYLALHEWVAAHKQKPDKCERCSSGTTKLELSNKSGKYLRDVNEIGRAHV